MTETDISLKKTYRWLTNTWKYAQHRSLLEKCKSKLQWDITSEWMIGSEWARIAIIKKSTNNKCWRGLEKRDCSCTVGGNVNWYSLYGRQYGVSIWWFYSSNPTHRHISWGNQNRTRHMYPLFIAALFPIARTRKQPRCPSTDEWIKKLWYIYTM